MNNLPKLLIVFLFFFSEKTHSQFNLNLESGIVGTGYNDIRIPGDKGTFFSLKNDLKAETKVYYRIRLGYTLNERHHFSLLYAPLTINSTGKNKSAIIFDDEVFPAQSDIEASYKFNSYRLTYRYDFVKNEKFELGLGFTAKIRDAEIKLESGSKMASYPNLGFVPIINIRTAWKFNDAFGILLDGDALVAKQGRAEDVLLAINYYALKSLNIFAGYRILEGGADNKKVYTFSMFNYAALGMNFTF